MCTVHSLMLFFISPGTGIALTCGAKWHGISFTLDQMYQTFSATSLRFEKKKSVKMKES